ncbi:MAG: methyl-accepting chemotaxis protein, partial [Planctomycetia bacterium]|nr:methyl-accepting chemotaxis protein [Planctomycetia bacterium]
MNTIQRLLVFTLGPVLVLAGLAAACLLNLRAVHRTQVNRYESWRLADELRRSSDELTRLARTYVVSGDPEYERQFWHVLAVRNGREPRPDGRRVALRTLMERQGFSAEEFAKLREAEDNSNALVTTERIAMHAMKGRFDDGQGGFTRVGPPDQALARRIMHDARYHADKKAIMDPIGEFEAMIDRRTTLAAERAWRRGNAVVLLGVGLALAAAATTLLALRRHAARPARRPAWSAGRSSPRT